MAETISLESCANDDDCVVLKGPVTLRSLFVSSSVLIAAAPVLASTPLAVASRLHMPVLHFPIALLVVALVVELIMRKRGDGHRAAVGALLALAAASAVVATASGIALENVEEAGGELVEWHERLGILTAVLSTLSAVAYRRPAGGLRKLSLPLMLGSALTVMIAGHLGGKLVHGADYYAKAFAPPAPKTTATATKKAGDDDRSARSYDDDDGEADKRDRRPEGAIPEKPDFEKDIKPILKASCIKCHGPEKRKGGLRLDEKRFAMKGGESGASIVPGDPSKSLLYTMSALPGDDEDVMPEKGKLLALSELETLKRWIEQGAVWPDDAPTP